MSSLKLYLLVFNNGLHFKVGITESKNFGRILQIDRLYGVDLRKSYLVSANSDRTIKLLEKQILNEFIPYKVGELYKTRDGATEILLMSCIEQVLGDIEYKKLKNYLGINIIVGIDSVIAVNSAASYKTRPVPRHKYVSIQWMDFRSLYNVVERVKDDINLLSIYKISPYRGANRYLLIEWLSQREHKDKSVLNFVFNNWRYSYQGDSSRSKSIGGGTGGANLMGSLSTSSYKGVFYLYMDICFDYESERHENYLNYNGLVYYLKSLENLFIENKITIYDVESLIVKDKFNLISNVDALIKKEYINVYKNT